MQFLAFVCMFGGMCVFAYILAREGSSVRIYVPGGLRHYVQGNMAKQFVYNLTGMYCVVSAAGLVVWAVCWLGIVLRNVVQWFLGALWYPWWVMFQ
jgi:hypothetical protein